MSRDLQVWGAHVMAAPHWPTIARQVRAVVAARSRAEAARAMGVSSRWLSEYGSITGNQAELAVALSEPGVLFVATDDQGYGRTFAEVRS